jgi:hypothetical protein
MTPQVVPAAVSARRRSHLRRCFQQWRIIVIGLAIPATALAGGTRDISVAMNAAFLSFILLMSTAFEIVELHVWQDVCEFICGLWISASPFLFGYAAGSPLTYWHLGLGMALLLGASYNVSKDANAFAMWQEIMSGGRRTLRRYRRS